MTAPVTQPDSPVEPTDVTETLDSGLPAAPVAPPARPGGRTRLTIVAIVLALALIALIALSAVSLLRGSTAKDKDKASQQAVAAAIADMPKIASYSYATIDADKKRAEAAFVPALRSKYDQIFSTLGATLAQNKVAVTVQVDEAQAIGVDSTTSVRVLIFFEQQSTAPSSATPMLTRYAYALTMEKVGSTWLIGAANPAD